MVSKKCLFALVALSAAACSELVPTPGTTPSFVEPTESCGPLVIDPAVVDPLTIVLDSAIRARERDVRCGPPGHRRRVCRALWLAQQLDPVPLIVGGDSLAADHIDILLWALSDGAEAASGDLEVAFEALGELTADLLAGHSESELATIVELRASQSILEPIQGAEASC